MSLDHSLEGVVVAAFQELSYSTANVLTIPDDYLTICNGDWRAFDSTALKVPAGNIVGSQVVVLILNTIGR